MDIHGSDYDTAQDDLPQCGSRWSDSDDSDCDSEMDEEFDRKLASVYNLPVMAGFKLAQKCDEKDTNKTLASSSGSSDNLSVCEITLLCMYMSHPNCIQSVKEAGPRPVICGRPKWEGRDRAFTQKAMEDLLYESNHERYRGLPRKLLIFGVGAWHGLEDEEDLAQIFTVFREAATSILASLADVRSIDW